MLKRLLSILLVAIFAIHLGGCSSSDSESENTEATSDTDLDAVDEGGEVAETANPAPEGDVLADLGNDSTGTADGGVKSDEAIESTLPDDPVAAPTDAPSETETIAESTAPSTEPAAPTDTGSEDLFGGSSTAANEPPTEASVETAPKQVVSLKKVKDKPYTESGVLANTVYVARKGDNWNSVAEKVGRSVEDLKKASYIKRGLKVGDKVYYNSPKRPVDADRMLTYYEDNSVPEQTYVAKAGDNLRDVAKNLLGDKESWKEIWSTNAIESKGALDEGTSFRYWPGGAAVAANEPPPIQEPSTPDLPPPPDMNQPPAPDAGAVGSVEPPPPPPPMDPPPPPPPVESKPPKMAKKSDGLLIPGLGQDETFMVLGVGLFVLLAGSIVLVRKSRAKRLSSTTQTQI